MNYQDTEASCTVQAMTEDEMAEAERKAGGAVDIWMRAYRGLPTAANFDGVLDRMRDYQQAWMNGRKRVKVL